MHNRLIFLILAICIFCNSVFCIAEEEEQQTSTESEAGAPCETEDDLDFESCDLKDLSEEVLKGICDRIGLDLEQHVLPFLYDEEIEEEEDEYSAATYVPDKHDNEQPKKVRTHEDYVKGAEECLLIEEEMDQLEEDDPDYLEELEREALLNDPEMVAEVLADVLKQDNALLTEIASKLTVDAPDTVKEMEGMLGEGEALHERPDVVGFIIAKMLAEEQDLGILDELDHALATHFHAWGDESIGGGDEL